MSVIRDAHEGWKQPFDVLVRLQRNCDSAAAEIEGHRTITRELPGMPDDRTKIGVEHLDSQSVLMARNRKLHRPAALHFRHCASAENAAVEQQLHEPGQIGARRYQPAAGEFPGWIVD